VKKEEVKEEKKVEKKGAVKTEKKKGLAQTSDYDIQNPTLKVVDTPSPVKTSIKGRGCNAANNCDATATRVPCCKVAKVEAKKDAKPKSGLAQVLDEPKKEDAKDGAKDLKDGKKKE